ncbi:BRCT domain-containing protein [Agrobacterium rubi]|uniref:NAD-dependent DNA ligase n=1 Tax=Agrobacterium rubi TaxID=28099 RepID=A0AAE7UM09_9HYPH|nr:BRCT domain-containing protein [Agrobacterium rubi]NTE86806.1 NAD-dependent DNA ligase [Agrobacterium rubi]NTF02740.1 NAD-dependent DNA ligase [Agrobacterium rubi]NTF36984.1 NAD-dependent DNA ligase [Agrobacterium rubi]OCJ55416.1 NAD-dependent DNA ligase [Agrobacterium rubi]QTF99422.1 NAD-dependent DNA ligase [Agrobacterium rubi]
MNPDKLVRISNDRLSSRQVDELIGLARGLIADGAINQQEVEFLQRWLAANEVLSDNPLIGTLYRRVTDILADGHVDQTEMSELLETLGRFANNDFELGEILKSTTLPLCSPAPDLTFLGQNYCFTGTFNFGQRKHCEAAVVERGASTGNLTRKTNVLVVGIYATESWKHSSFGNKIVQASELRNNGQPIAIVSEEHWTKYL